MGFAGEMWPLPHDTVTRDHYWLYVGRIVAPWSSFGVQIRISSQIYMVGSNFFNNWAPFDYRSPYIYPLTDIIDLWTYLTAQGKDRAQVMSLRQQQQGYQTRRLFWSGLPRWPTGPWKRCRLPFVHRGTKKCILLRTHRSLRIASNKPEIVTCCFFASQVRSILVIRSMWDFAWKPAGNGALLRPIYTVEHQVHGMENKSGKSIE